jgi:hypothetical protein
MELTKHHTDFLLWLIIVMWGYRCEQNEQNLMISLVSRSIPSGWGQEKKTGQSL